jgi:hypothetical protein
VTVDEETQLAAGGLGLSIDELRNLREALEPVRHNGEVTIARLDVIQDSDGAPVWEIEIEGTIAVPGRVLAAFRFRVLVDGDELWRGSSQTPDRYEVVAEASGVLFAGEVEHPDTPDDEAGWARYGVFTPVTLAAFDAVFARLVTDRPVVRGPVDPDRP